MAEQKIQLGMLVKAGGNGIKIPITTMNSEGRIYKRTKHTKPGQFLFGTVTKVYTDQALIQWAGPKYRISTLPLEMLIPAINQNHPRRK